MRETHKQASEGLASKQKMVDDIVDIFGVPVFSGGRGRVLDWGSERLSKTDQKGTWVVLTPTTEQVVMAQNNDALCASFQKADINVPDSLGLILADWWSSRVEGKSWRLKERITGVDLAMDWVAEAAKQGKKVFLLGGKGDTAELAAEKLKQEYSGLKIKGMEGITDIKSEIGDRRYDSRDMIQDSRNKNQESRSKQAIEQINEWGTDLLLVAFGAPWQERWLIENQDKLKVKLAMAVGGAFDMWAGKIRRAPLGMRKIGLEWLWRLMMEPWRWKRQLRLLKFMGMVLF